MEEIDHLLVGLKWTGRFALLVLCNAPGELGVDAAPLRGGVLVAINDCFRLKYDLAAFAVASNTSPTLTPICSRTLCGMTTWNFFLTVTIDMQIQPLPV